MVKLTVTSLVKITHNCVIDIYRILHVSQDTAIITNDGETTLHISMIDDIWSINRPYHCIEIIQYSSPEYSKWSSKLTALHGPINDEFITHRNSKLFKMIMESNARRCINRKKSIELEKQLSNIKSLAIRNGKL